MGQGKQSDRERLLRLLAGDAPSHPDSGEASGVRLMEKQTEATGADWRDGLPVLCGTRVTLRELQLIDVPGLDHQPRHSGGHALPLTAAADG